MLLQVVLRCAKVCYVVPCCSLGSGNSFAHVKHALIMCSISMATDRPGEQTDIWALARHLLMPRWP